MDYARFEAAEMACELLRAERDKLQKQSDLLTLGLLQEKRKTATLLKTCKEAAATFVGLVEGSIGGQVMLKINRVITNADERN